VDVTIDGLAASAMVDTGGLGIGGTIDAGMLTQMGRADEQLSSTDAHGAHEVAQMQRLTAGQVKVGGASVEDLLYLVTPNPVFPNDGGAGLLGSRFLCQFLVEVDLGESQIVFYPRDTDPNTITSGQWLQVGFEDFMDTGGIVLDMAVNGTPVKAVLDTGSPFTGINWQASQQAGVSPRTEGVREFEVPGHGLNAKAPIITHEFGFDLSLADGQLAFRDDQVRIKDIHALKQIFGDEPGMIVGLNFFEGRRVLIDYQQNQLYLSKAG
jgi:predicted aspartyl protease